MPANYSILILLDNGLQLNLSALNLKSELSVNFFKADRWNSFGEYEKQSNSFAWPKHTTCIKQGACSPRTNIKTFVPVILIC